MAPEGNALALMARYPRPGAVKTRLAATIGHPAALALYSAFLRDLDERLGYGPWSVTWLYTPVEDPFPDWIGPGRIAAPQTGASLSDRLLNGFRDLLRHYQRVVVMSTDSPHLPLEWIERGFGLLDAHDVVLGPCDDGGYYLIGMRQPHDLFSGVPMSTPAVLAATLTLARDRGLSVALLPATFDLDDASGLGALLQWLEDHPARNSNGASGDRQTTVPDLPRTRAVLKRRDAIGAASVTLSSGENT